MDDAKKDRPAKHVDLEIKDAQLIFNSVWKELEEEYTPEKLNFPHEIIWLGGAPGAGKGTNTPFILKTREISAEPIVTSGLLKSPAAQKIKDAGGLVGDREVIGILFRRLLDPEFDNGVIVDGFPRTKVQVECLQLFYHKMIKLQEQFRGTPLADKFRYPIFRIILLFVDEEESVKRQLQRGIEVREKNKRAVRQGKEIVEEERPTDSDPEAAKNRYRVFKETTFDTLTSLREIFHFHFIDASGTLKDVQKNIEKELFYQSSLELEPETFDKIRHVPLASEIVMFGRQDLVNRLDSYIKHEGELFNEVVTVIDEKLIPIIQRHAMTGLAFINSENPIFDKHKALTMLIDIFTERGYHAVVDINKIEVPDTFDLKTGKITCREKKVYRFRINFTPSAIRRGHD